MRLQAYRVRTLMIAVGVIALLISGVGMASRSYAYHRLARQYGENERGWREIVSRSRTPERKPFHSDCVRYFEQLSAKYRRAMWQPWMPVPPDPHEPGYDGWLDQERQAKAFRPEASPPDPPIPASPSP